MTRNMAELQEIEQDVRQKTFSPPPAPKPVALKPLHPAVRNSPQAAPQ